MGQTTERQPRRPFGRGNDEKAGTDRWQPARPQIQSVAHINQSVLRRRNQPTRPTPMLPRIIAPGAGTQIVST